MQKPLVTIVTVTYNLIDSGRKDYFEQCLKSVRDQMYENIEHIIIDGGSKDGSVELIKKYADKSWIKYISESDNGIYDAMNKGIKKAKGEYIAFLNSDDYYLHNNVILLSVKKIIEDNADFSYGKCVLKYEKYDVIMGNNIEKFLFSMPFAHPTMIAKVSILKELGYFNEKYGLPADYGLIVRMILEDYKGVYVKNKLVGFRVIGPSSSENYSNEIANIYMDNYADFYTFLNVEQAKALKYEKNIPDKFIENFKHYARNREYKNIDICKVVSELRLLEKQKDKSNEVCNNDMRITANLATFPAREKKLQIAIKSIIDQVDILNIYLNEYESVPNFLKKKKINCVLGNDCAGDLKDNGKFYFLNKAKENSYYFTIDDDIIYPKDYVEKMVCILNKHKNEIVVGVHGTILHQDIENFFLDRMNIHFTNDLDKPMFVNMLGTGTVAFYVKTLMKMNVFDFKSKGMVDVWLAAFCRESDVPMLCVDRNEKWLRDVCQLVHDEDTLYNTYQNTFVEQISIINQFNINSLRNQNLVQYIAILESICKKHSIISYKSDDDIKQSKSFRLGDLFFRSIKKPYKFITYPYNFIKILIKN